MCQYSAFILIMEQTSVKQSDNCDSSSKNAEHFLAEPSFLPQCDHVLVLDCQWTISRPEDAWLPVICLMTPSSRPLQHEQHLSSDLWLVTWPVQANSTDRQLHYQLSKNCTLFYRLCGKKSRASSICIYLHIHAMWISIILMRSHSQMMQPQTW